MSTDSGFLQDVQQDPDNDAPRLIYADWLEENGNSERAELIRLQCERAHPDREIDALCRYLARWSKNRNVKEMSADDRNYYDLLHAWLQDENASLPAPTAEEKKLLKSHQKKWIGKLPFVVEFHRGFPEMLSLSVRDYLEHVDALERISPVQSIRITSFDPVDEDQRENLGEEEHYELEVGQVQQLAECPLLERWVELEIDACPGYDNYEALLCSPHLVNLRRLIAPGNEIGAGVSEVAQKTFSSLEWLDLYDSDSAGGRPSDDDFIEIVTSPHLAQLRYFNFGTNNAGDEGFRALAESTTMKNLRSLNVTGNYVGAKGIIALAESENLPAFRHLDFSCQFAEDAPNDETIEALIRGPLLPQLTFLSMDQNPFTDGGIARLVSCESVTNLRSLFIGGGSWDRTGDKLSEMSVEAILKSDRLTHLRELALIGIRVTDDLMIRLCNTQALSQIQALQVCQQSSLTDKGLNALKKRFGKRLTLLWALHE